MILGVDTGGTFTDFVLHDGKELKIHKVLSTPQYPEQAILAGIVEMGLQSALEKGGLLVIHGSTVATNAALEGKGVKTAYVTNYGFKDLLHMGRQNRPELYNLQPVNNPFPQPRGHCFEVQIRCGFAQCRQWRQVECQPLFANCLIEPVRHKILCS